MFLDANRPWRKVKVTARRTAIDFAVCMRELADLHYRKAERIRVVLDNLSTHSAGAFYQAFPAEQAQRLLHRIEFHYVPKHASWLNMVEIEIGVLAGQCLDRRIESYPRLTAEVAAWEKQRNGAQARIDWSFTTEKARTKMGRAYPRPTNLKRPRKKRKPLCQGTSRLSVPQPNAAINDLGFFRSLSPFPFCFSGDKRSCVSAAVWAPTAGTCWCFWAFHAMGWSRDCPLASSLSSLGQFWTKR